MQSFQALPGVMSNQRCSDLFGLVFVSAFFLFGSADPFLAVFCSLHPKHPKQVVDDLVARHKANPKQASTD